MSIPNTATPQSKEPKNAVHVLLFGASGFLGGTVLDALLNRSSSEVEYRVSVFTRPTNAAAFASLPVNMIQGSYSELGLVESAAASHDVVINAGTSDDLMLTKTINKGLAASRARGKKAVLVHVSGTQLIEGPPTGAFDDKVPIYDDSDLSQIEGIDVTAFHRLIDLEIRRADLAGEVVGSIICPGIIYGQGRGPQKTYSGPWHSLAELALSQQRATYAAKGTNKWAVVHVSDVAELIMLAMENNLKTPAPAGFERFYFAENGEFEFKEKVEKLGQILHRANALPTAETGWLPCADPRSPAWPLKTNSRCKAMRSRQQLGWKPQHDFHADFEQDAMFNLKLIQEKMAAQQ